MRETMLAEHIIDYTVIYAMDSRHYVFWFVPINLYRGLFKHIG